MTFLIYSGIQCAMHFATTLQNPRQVPADTPLSYVLNVAILDRAGTIVLGYDDCMVRPTRFCVIESFIHNLIMKNIKKFNNTNVVYAHMHA